VRRILAHLLAAGAIGAVSTHDLTLADAPELAPRARLAHFTETIEEGPGGPRMSFDYTLRPGLATSTNALRLMQIVGLDLE
jgi:DNA mismatch repair ATPase MutS